MAENIIGDIENMVNLLMELYDAATGLQERDPVKPLHRDCFKAIMDYAFVHWGQIKIAQESEAMGAEIEKLVAEREQLIKDIKGLMVTAKAISNGKVNQG